MNRTAILTTAILISACATDDLELSADEQAASSYRPMGFARVSSDGSTVSSGFNSSGGGITATRMSTGYYRVSFVGLSTSSLEPASLGNVQVVAEGTNNVRCQLQGTTTTSITLTLGVLVYCSAADGTLADSAFAVLYHRAAMPAPTTFAANHAYTMINGDGTLATPRTDYNASGTHNSAMRTGVGTYKVTIPNALATNASVMVTASEISQPGNTCAVTSWTAGSININCRDHLGNLADTRFSLSYAVSGPTADQQGAHALFNGTLANSSLSAALGKYSWCSTASVSASRTGSLATVVVTGDLGSWDATPFVHVPFVSRHSSTGGYCKIESTTSSGSAPSWTGTATVRCYSATGGVIATPVFTFTDVTNNPTGPC